MPGDKLIVVLSYNLCPSFHGYAFLPLFRIKNFVEVQVVQPVMEQSAVANAEDRKLIRFTGHAFFKRVVPAAMGGGGVWRALTVPRRERALATWLMVPYRYCTVQLNCWSSKSHRTSRPVGACSFCSHLRLMVGDDGEGVPL